MYGAEHYPVNGWRCKKQDHRAAASKPTHKDQCVPWYLLPFNPISNVCIMHVNAYILLMLYMKGHVDDHVLHVHVYVYIVPPCCD